MLYRTTESAELPLSLKNLYKNADGPSLKVALYLLCENGSRTENDIAEELRMPEETVERALSLWQAAGLVKTDESGQKTSKETKPAVTLTAKRTLSPSEVTEISLRDPEIEILLRETQEYIKRPLDSLESRVLLEMYEFNRLPSAVILTIIAFLMPRVKNKRSVISKAARMADSWSERGINDPRLADAEIRLLELREKREREVAAVLSASAEDFNKSSRASIARWFEEYGYNADFVKEAYLRTGKSEIPYLNSVLKNWYKKGYTSIKDTRAETSNAAPETAKRERGENSLIKRALSSRKQED